jgi:hypothetical protein
VTHLHDCVYRAYPFQGPPNVRFDGYCPGWSTELVQRAATTLRDLHIELLCQPVSGRVMGAYTDSNYATTLLPSLSIPTPF